MPTKSDGSGGWESLFRERKINFIPDKVRDLFFTLINPVVKWAINTKLHPNFFTILGLVLSACAAAVIGLGHFFWGGVLILLGGICDIVDGKVARAKGLGSKFGALFDSTLDRYAEIIMFLGISFYFIREDMLFTSVIAFLALGGSLMVSYVRARAEGLGLECKVGIMQRPERIVYLGFGAMAGQIPFIVVLYMIAILANYTAIQRVVHVWKISRVHDSSKESAKQEDNLTHYPPPAHFDN